MQPGPPPDPHYPHQQPQQPVAGWPPAPGHWGAQSPPATGAGAATASGAPVRTGRPGLVALVAVLVELIVIAAADNQWVAQRVSDAALDHPDSLGYDFALALVTFQWRFSPAAGDRFHALYGQWALLGVLVVVTAILVLMVARGRAGFARVFFATWAAVVAAAGLGAIARAAIVDGRLLQGKSRFQYALFSDLGPSQHVFVAGLGLGLVVALAAGLTAVAARRDADAAPSGPRDEAAPVAVAAPQRTDVRNEAPTMQFDRGPTDPDATQQFREPDPAEQFRSPRDAQAEPEPTQEMPRLAQSEPEPTQEMPRVDQPPREGPEA